MVCTHRSLSVNVIRVLTQISGITREQSRHCIVIWACSLLWIMSACNRCNLPCKLMLHYYTVLYHFAQLFGRCCYLLLNWMWNAYVLSYVHCNNAVVVFLALRLSSSFGFGLIKFQNLIFAARCRPTWAHRAWTTESSISCRQTAISQVTSSTYWKLFLGKFSKCGARKCLLAKGSGVRATCWKGDAWQSLIAL